MDRKKYNQAWNNLLAARRREDFSAVHQCSEALAHEARLLALEGTKSLCSHFMVINGHCIGCGDAVRYGFGQHEEAK